MALPLILNIYNKLIKIDSAPGFFFNQFSLYFKRVQYMCKYCWLLW